jgi:hypothetical protein
VRTDPYERADVTSNTYYDWHIHHVFIVYPMLAAIGKFVETFEAFPPAQHPDSFTIGDALKKVTAVASGG